MTLIDYIIDQYERSTKWNNVTTGNSSFRIEEKHKTAIGNAAIVEQAKELEQEHLLRIRWIKGYMNYDMEKVEYPLTSMACFYEKARRKPKYQFVAEQQKLAEDFYKTIKKPWIKKYMETEVFPGLKKGKYEDNQEFMELRIKCLAGLDQLEAPVFKRIFSKRYLNNSKIFEEKLQKTIVNIARKYLGGMENEPSESDSLKNLEEYNLEHTIYDTMEDSEVLAELYIEEYSQELYVKGSLHIEVEGSRIDTGCFPYGTVLTTQTLKNAVILDNPQIKTILTIENKANFIAEPYKEGTLILFSHGFFTPVERMFLIRLKKKLEGQKVTYLHSGDLDYGGVRIFQFIKNKIFPDLRPWRMDLETFQTYFSFGESITDTSLEKLMQCQEPLLQNLIDRIIETRTVIEQEAYL